MDIQCAIRGTAMYENDLYKLERKCSACLITASDAYGLYYATAPDDNRIVLFTDGTKNRSIVLTKLQAEKLAEELPDILCMIGRGKVHFAQGRRHL